MAVYKNVSRTIGFSLVNTDGTANTSATPTCSVAQDTGNYAACANSAVRKTLSAAATNGFHLVLTSTEMNADLVKVMITATGCVPVEMNLYPEADYTSARAVKVDNLDAAVTTRMATFTLPTNFSVLAIDGSGQVTVGALAANVITSTSLAASALTAIGGAVWDTTRAGHSTAGTFGQGVASVQGNITGNVAGSVASVTAAVDTTAGSNTAIATAVWAVTMTELSSVPSSTDTVLKALSWVFHMARYKRTQTATTETLFKSDGSTTLGTSSKSDDTVTYIRGAWG